MPALALLVVADDAAEDRVAAPAAPLPVARVQRRGVSVKRGRRHADVHTSQAELSNWQVRTILGDQLRTRTEQKEACGARDDSSVLQAASSIKPPQAKIDAAAACLDRQRIDLQRNTVAKHA